MPNLETLLSEFIVHRRGAFVSGGGARLLFSKSRRAVNDALVKHFSAAARDKSSAYRRALQAYQDSIKIALNSRVIARHSREEPDVEEDFAQILSPVKGHPKLVLKLPHVRFDIKSDSFQARVVTRLSLTACAIQRLNGRSKLWVTSEILPLDGLEMPIADLVDIFDSAAESALPLLVESIASFVQAHAPGAKGTADNLSLVLEEPRLRVTFADDLDPALVTYVEAVALDHVAPADAGQLDPATYNSKVQQEGRCRFETFIADLEGNSIPANSIAALPEDVPADQRKRMPELNRIIAVFVTNPIEIDSERPQMHVTGISRRLGTGGFRNFPADDPELAEVLARGASGARLASAAMASRVAEQFEAMLPQVSARRSKPLAQRIKHAPG